jgi:hypothetical protein
MRQVVWVFLWAAPAWVLAAHGLAWRLRLSQALTMGAHAATTLVAAGIALRFVVQPGVTVAQFAAGSAAAEAAFSGWVVMWPTLLLALGVGGSVLAMASLFVACDRQTWR